MPAVTRKGDSETGVCDLGYEDCPHGRGGTNSSTSPNVFVNNLGLHRLNDSGPCNCPHGGSYKSTTGSSTVFVNGRPATRIGDVTTCTNCGQSGNHVSGSPNVFVGG